MSRSACDGCGTPACETINLTQIVSQGVV
jgi:hypothetical protein